MLSSQSAFTFKGMGNQTALYTVPRRRGVLEFSACQTALARVCMSLKVCGLCHVLPEMSSGNFKHADPVDYIVSILGDCEKAPMVGIDV